MSTDRLAPVEVFWQDAGLEKGQLSIEEAQGVEPMPRKNRGYLIVETKEKIVICSGIIEDKNCGEVVCDQVLVIPQGMVTKLSFG